MESILDAPVAADLFGQGLHFGRQTAHDKDGFFMHFVSADMMTIDHPHAAHILPFMPQAPVGRHRGNVVFAPLGSAMSSLVREVRTPDSANSNNSKTLGTAVISFDLSSTAT